MTDTERASALGTWCAFLGKGYLSPAQPDLEAAVQHLPALPLSPAKADLRQALADALRQEPVEIATEHVRLFLSPDGAPCSPWQSAYGEDEQLMGPPHHSVLAWYRDEGLEPRHESEPADHVGLLLVFWARLLESAADEQKLECYWREHLAWTPQFCALVREHARHPFYRLLAEVTESLVRDNAPAEEQVIAMFVVVGGHSRKIRQDLGDDPGH